MTTSSAVRQAQPGDELREFLGLVSVVRLVIANYTRATAGTGDDQVVRRAALRMERGLTEMERVAKQELTPAVEPEPFECISCGRHDLARDLREFRIRGEVSAVVLMRKFRYRFDHAARALENLEAQGFVEWSGPSLTLVDFGSRIADTGNGTGHLDSAFVETALGENYGG